MKKLLVSLLAVLAVFTLSAQDLTATYNAGAKAFGAKKYAEAAEAFEKVISEGVNAEGAEATVATAKKYLPVCYFQLGGASARTKKYDVALSSFIKSAELAELYGDMTQMSKSNGWVARIYQTQGGEAFNSKNYAAAVASFEKGYKANPRNTNMALNLAMSYCELGDYEKGMEVYAGIIALTHPRYAKDVAKAKEMVTLYTNNKVAKMQAAADFDGIIAMADGMLVKDANNALAHKVRLQAYANKKDYNKVIELAAATAAVQTDENDKSLAYLTLGMAYNAKEMKPQAISALQKVTAGPAVESAKAALVVLTKK